MTPCPLCDEPLSNMKACKCGWKLAKQGTRFVDSAHGTCSWITNGVRCQRVGNISPSVSEPKEVISGEGSKAKWYCGWHYCALSDIRIADIYSPQYRDWYEQEAIQSKRYEKKALGEGWDKNDALLFKGLAFIGPESTTWKRAPKECQDAAMNLIRSGYKPKLQKIPDLTDEERLAIEQE